MCIPVIKNIKGILNLYKSAVVCTRVVDSFFISIQTKVTVGDQDTAISKTGGWTGARRVAQFVLCLAAVYKIVQPIIFPNRGSLEVGVFCGKRSSGAGRHMVGPLFIVSISEASSMTIQPGLGVIVPKEPFEKCAANP